MQEMREMWIQSVSWEDSLEEETATHSSILAWKISWTEEPGGLQSKGLQSQDRTERLSITWLMQSPFMQKEKSRNILYSLSWLEESNECYTLKDTRPIGNLLLWINFINQRMSK